MTRLCPSLCAALAIASCSDQPSTAPASTFAGGQPTIAVTVSDSSAAIGSMVSVSLDVQQPRSVSPIGAFRARLAFDATGLQYIDEAPEDPGVHAVNVGTDTVRIAGAAPGAGFADGRLVTLRFRVLAPSALRSLTLVLDELKDLTFRDRRDDFTGPHLSVPRIVADVTPPASSTRAYGDATADGTIDASDALAILTKDVGLSPPAGFDSVAADVNTDGVVDALDAQILLASLVGRDVSEFRVGDVIGATPVTITAIAPDTLRPGVTTTITGINFSGTVVNDTVIIDSIPAVVTAATTTQLTVTVPPTIPCRPTHPAVVTVRVNGTHGNGRQMLVMAPQQSMHVGDALVLDSDAAFRCNEFPSGEYLVAVYNSARETSPTPTSFSLVSTGATGLNNMVFGDRGVSSRPTPPVVRNRLPAPTPWRFAPGDELRRQRALAHLQFMEQDRQLIANAKLGAVRRTTSPGTGSGLPLARNISQTVGGYSTLNVIRPDYGDTAYYVTVRARTVYVGVHEVILEDVQAPLAGQMDSYYQKLGAEFDNVMYPILTANFGDPMAMDASLSGVGRIVMLFTPAVSAYRPTTEAFVTGCDFLTVTDCRATNRTEVFYSVVPTTMTPAPGIDPRYDENTPAGWYSEIRGTLIHESKHIATLAEKFSLSPHPLIEESWLEEGTAQIASELYARTLSGNTWKGNAMYQPTLACEVNVCPGYSFTMFDHFGWLHDYEVAADSLSPINAGSVDPTIYGSAWLLMRWAADMYASTEPSFFKALIQQVTTNGVSNLEARTGQPWPTLLGRWALAVAADHSPELTQSPGIPSWNTRDVFLGLHENLAEFTTPYPLRMPAYATSVLSLDKNVAAGSAAFFDLTFSGQQSIAIRATATSELPHTTPVRLSIIRIH